LSFCLWTSDLQYKCYTSCLAEVKEARALAKVAQSVTGRYFVTTFKGSPSPPSEGWLAVEVSSVSLASFMKKLVVSSRLVF